MPDDNPPAVARLPSSTNLAPRFRLISGNCVANETNAPWYVVAALPDKSPVFARTNAPVQTDMVTSAFLVDLRIQSSITAAGSLWAGITMTFGAGVDRMGCLGNGIKAEWRIPASGNYDILEDFPRSGEIDHHRAFRKKEGNRDPALRGGSERFPFAVPSGIAGTTSRSDRIRTRADFT